MSGVPELGSKQQTQDFASGKQVREGGSVEGIKDGQVRFLRSFLKA